MGAMQGKMVVLGVTGGIAAYKAATVASLLIQSGAQVDVVLTEGAQRFIRPLTFSAITHRPVYGDPFAPWGDDFSGHVSLANRADIVIVAPATAATIARLALGLSDDLLGLIALTTRAPMVIAPAMEDRMFRHAATHHHLQTLQDRGVFVVGPETGRLASGATGAGRMTEPEQIVRRVDEIVRSSNLLAGTRIVVTAGGTREALDPVRYLGNRSSGRMGFAIAEAAIARGADVTLIAGPTAISPPADANVVPVESAMEMLAAVEDAVADADVLIMAAAVADFRPETRRASKIKKEHGQDHYEFRLVRNPDILATVNKPGLVKIGFAAETDNLIEHATAKLHAKNLAMIVANDAESTIDALDSTATFIMADGAVKTFPRSSKRTLADEIIRAATDLLATAQRHDP